MFLTTFDKKMYEEAIRQEGREEVEDEKRLLEEKNATLTQQIDEQARMLTEQTKQLEVERSRVAELEALLANKSE